MLSKQNEQQKMSIVSPRLFKNAAIVSVIIGVLVFVVFAILLLFGNYQYSGFDLDDDSLDITYKIGGFIGSIVGPIWALAGIFLYYTALSYQKDDIKKSQEASEIQSFENTFFSLIETQRDITKNLTGSFKLVQNHEQHDVVRTGHSFFRQAQYHLSYIYCSFLKTSHAGFFYGPHAEHLQEDTYNYSNQFNFDDNKVSDLRKLQYSSTVTKYKITKEVWDKGSKLSDSKKIQLTYKLFFMVINMKSVITLDICIIFYNL